MRRRSVLGIRWKCWPWKSLENVHAPRRPAYGDGLHHRVLRRVDDRTAVRPTVRDVDLGAVVRDAHVPGPLAHGDGRGNFIFGGIDHHHVAVAAVAEID